jgi:hypothetical protein
LCNLKLQILDCQCGPQEHLELQRLAEEETTMSVIGMPSLAFLLVLTNFALCLSADQQRHRTDTLWPASAAQSAPSRALKRNIERSALTAIAPLPTD